MPTQNPQRSVERTTFGKGKTTFQMGRTTFGRGKTTFQMGKTTFGGGKTTFQMGRTIFGGGKTIFQMGETTFGRLPQVDMLHHAAEKLFKGCSVNCLKKLYL
jgi:hypothetical protein